MNSISPLTFPSLAESFKQRFTFRLSVPSFIYPAGYIENIQRLAPFVDEIELLLFESAESSLPQRSEIDEMASLAYVHKITYNVHLPIDLDLANSDRQIRRQGVERLTNAIDRVRPLSPTTHTLHLPFNEADTKSGTVEKWVLHNRESLFEILDAVKIAPDNISIETLSYPPFWFEQLVAELDLAVCIDIGHLLRYGFNLESVWNTFKSRTTMIHLHGVYRGEDHLSLNRIAAEHREQIRTCLGDYTGGLSLEVFSFERLVASLSCLVRMFPPDPGNTTQGRKVSSFEYIQKSK